MALRLSNMNKIKVSLSYFSLNYAQAWQAEMSLDDFLDSSDPRTMAEGN